MYSNPILKSLKNFNYYLIFWTVLAFLFIQLLYIGTDIGLTASITDGLVFTFLLGGIGLTLWYPARYIPIEKNSPLKIILSHSIGALITTIIWLSIGYFLLAPQKMMGLNAGALGLAIKTVVLNVIFVNVQLFFNSRFLGLRFWRYLGHQVLCVGSLLGCACTATFCIEYFVGLHDKILLSFFLSGLFYTLLVIGVAYFQPIVVGLKRSDIHTIIQFIRRKNNWR